MIYTIHTDDVYPRPAFRMFGTATSFRELAFLQARAAMNSQSDYERTEFVYILEIAPGERPKLIAAWRTEDGGESYRETDRVQVLGGAIEVGGVGYEP